MTKKQAAVNEITFEESLRELELIAKALEEGNLSLDESLTNFEKGIGLSRICSQKLEQAEKKIDFLMKTQDGELVLKPAETTEE